MPNYADGQRRQASIKVKIEDKEHVDMLRKAASTYRKGGFIYATLLNPFHPTPITSHFPYVSRLLSPSPTLPVIVLHRVSHTLSKTGARYICLRCMACGMQALSGLARSVLHATVLKGVLF